MAEETTSPQAALFVRSFINLAIASLLAYGIFVLLGPFVLPVIAGTIISALSRPLYAFLLRIVRLPGLAALLTVLVSIAAIVLPLAVLAGAVAREVGTLNNVLASSPYSIDRLNDLINQSSAGLGLTNSIDLRQYVDPALKLLSDHASLIIGSVFGTLLSAFLAMVTAFYMLQSKQEFQETVSRYSPLSKADTMTIIERAREVVRATVMGNLVLLVIQAVASMVGFFIFGISTPVLLGILYGVTSLVPSIGSSIIWVPVVLFQLVQGNTTAAIGVTCWALAQVIIFDHYVGPILIEKRAHLHPFLILLGVLGGVSHFGAVGVVLGPTMVALGIVGLELLHRSWQTSGKQPTA